MDTTSIGCTSIYTGMYDTTSIGCTSIYTGMKQINHRIVKASKIFCLGILTGQRIEMFCLQVTPKTN